MGPYDLLEAELRRDAGRPLVTYYDDAAGERVELSVATFDKLGGQDRRIAAGGADVSPGDRVAVRLPPHWQALVCAMACWAVGACVVLDSLDDLAVAVVGPGELDLAAPEVVALALRPLGGRFTEPLPVGILDCALEVPSYPDRLAPYDALPPDTLALDDGTAVTIGQLVERAEQPPPRSASGPVRGFTYPRPIFLMP